MRHDDGTVPTEGKVAFTIVMALLVSVPTWGISPSALAQPSPGPDGIPEDPIQALPGDDMIQPGDPVTGDPLDVGAGSCTISYVLDGPDTVYVAVPSRCVEPGQTLSTPGFPGFAEVVHVSEAARVALAEVRAEDAPNVDGTVENHPGAPTGVTDPLEVQPGDPLVTPTGTGLLASHGASQASFLVTGDAHPFGTPVVHAATGRLVAHVDTVGVCVRLPSPSYGCGLPPARIAGPTAAHALEVLDDEGFDVELRTGSGQPGPVQAIGEVAMTATRTVVDQDNVIQPGDALQTAGGAQICTYNFVFDGPDAVYIGTAAHCVHEGQRVSTAGFPTIGTVVHSGGGADVALVRIDEAYTEHVQAAVKGHPTVPMGVAVPADTAYGDLLYVSGYGVGFNQHDASRENRWGLQLTHSGSGYTAVAPFAPGDSGGPVVHGPSGQALGVAAWIAACIGVPVAGCDVPPARVGGPTIDRMLDVLDAHGFDVTLRTVDADGGLEQTITQTAATVTRTAPVGG